MGDEDRLMGVAGRVVVRHEGRVLLLQRSPDCSHDAGLWELPGGKLEYGEELTSGLAREVREETGLAVRLERPFFTSHFTKPPFWVTTVTFVADLLGDDPHVELSDENSAAEWVDPRALAAYPLSLTVREQLDAYLSLESAVR